MHFVSTFVGSSSRYQISFYRSDSTVILFVSTGYLDLGYNSNLGGTIPSEIGNLQNLGMLYASRDYGISERQGSFILKLALWIDLIILPILTTEQFVAPRTSLTGSIPSELGNCTSLGKKPQRNSRSQLDVAQKLNISESV